MILCAISAISFICELDGTWRLSDLDWLDLVRIDFGSNWFVFTAMEMSRSSWTGWDWIITYDQRVEGNRFIVSPKFFAVPQLVCLVQIKSTFFSPIDRWKSSTPKWEEKEYISERKALGWWFQILSLFFHPAKRTPFDAPKFSMTSTETYKKQAWSRSWSSVLEVGVAGLELWWNPTVRQRNPPKGWTPQYPFLNPISIRNSPINTPRTPSSLPYCG